MKSAKKTSLALNRALIEQAKLDDIERILAELEEYKNGSDSLNRRRSWLVGVISGATSSLLTGFALFFGHESMFGGIFSGNISHINIFMTVCLLLMTGFYLFEIWLNYGIKLKVSSYVRGGGGGLFFRQANSSHNSDIESPVSIYIKEMNKNSEEKLAG